jgi:hypothetical protein
MSSFESLIFYRGVSVKYEIDRPSVIEMRRDRIPKNSSIDFHLAADNWFLKRFGVAYRSQALFLCSRQLTAQTYAASPKHVMRIVPLTAYKYCWSPKVSDLLFAATTFATADVSMVENHLDSVGYREDGLTDAHDAGHEVMLHCERYMAIPVDLCTKEASKSRSLILVDGY